MILRPVNQFKYYVLRTGQERGGACACSLWEDRSKETSTCAASLQIRSKPRMEYPSDFRVQYMMRWGSRVHRKTAQGEHQVPQPLLRDCFPRALSGMAVAVSGTGMSAGTPERVVDFQGIEACRDAGKAGGKAGGMSGAGRNPLRPASVAHTKHAIDARADVGGFTGIMSEERLVARQRIVIPHADEAGMEDDGLNYLGHMLAGSIAGVTPPLLPPPPPTTVTSTTTTTTTTTTTMMTTTTTFPVSWDICLLEASLVCELLLLLLLLLILL